MRIHFAGAFSGTDPIILMFATPGTYSFDKTAYPDHNTYEVMAIGAGGGNGGGLAGQDPSNADWQVINFGGAGGGGGSHRLQGLLEILDDTTQVVVGAAGANGTDGGAVPGNSTDGQDGGYSSFGDFIKASGGKGGKRSQTLSSEENMWADGGEGGIGGSITAGGGAAGGICGLNDDPEKSPAGQSTPGVNGANGGLYLLDIYTVNTGWIGAGGGGGAPGWIRHDTVAGTWERQIPLPTNGGRGSYNMDELVSAPYGSPRNYKPEAAPESYLVLPGIGGGARVTPFNKSNKTYGDSQKNGIVIIRLTAE